MATAPWARENTSTPSVEEDIPSFQYPSIAVFPRIDPWPWSSSFSVDARSFEPDSITPGDAPQPPSLSNLAGRRDGKGENFSDEVLQAIIIKAQPHHSYGGLAHLSRSQLVKHVDDLVSWWITTHPGESHSGEQSASQQPRAEPDQPTRSHADITPLSRPQQTSRPTELDQPARLQAEITPRSVAQDVVVSTVTSPLADVSRDLETLPAPEESRSGSRGSIVCKSNIVREDYFLPVRSRPCQEGPCGQENRFGKFRHRFSGNSFIRRCSNRHRCDRTTI